MNDEKLSATRLLKVFGSGAAVSVVVTLIAMCVCALIASSSDLSEQTVCVFSVVCLSIGSLSGGLLSSVINGKNGLLCGLISGVVLLLLVCGGSLIISSSGISALTAVKAAAILVCGMLGGILGVNVKFKKRII